MQLVIVIAYFKVFNRTNYKNIEYNQKNILILKIIFDFKA